MSDGWCQSCIDEKRGAKTKPSMKDAKGCYTYLCGEHTLNKAREQRAEILRIANEPGMTWKVRRALLREKFGFAENLIDELVGKEEKASDY